MSYLPEQIREAIITRITDFATTQSSFYRTPSPALDASWPAFILEYGENQNLWNGSESDKKVFLFNLYVAYSFNPADDDSIELAEKAISDSIGELYRVVFEKPGCLNLANGWVRVSNVSWGYGGSEDVPLRMATMQIEVKVHQDRS
ncbi:hypothetical protein [Novosphingobium aquae]|uniref:Tail terminator protein n=1 Tax=Novosphingobium aquae TaxID=3133435 RepID=A0ABU8SD69_9SPHN